MLPFDAWRYIPPVESKRDSHVATNRDPFLSVTFGQSNKLQARDPSFPQAMERLSRTLFRRNREPLRVKQHIWNSLMQYQRECVRNIVEHNGLLGVQPDPGLGKTLIFTAACTHFGGMHLLMEPKTMVVKAAEEVAKWAADSTGMPVVVLKDAKEWQKFHNLLGSLKETDACSAAGDDTDVSVPVIKREH